MIEPHHMITGSAALVAVLAIHVVVPAALAIVARLRASRDLAKAKEADDTSPSEAPFAPGEATIRGEVELSPGSDLALRVEIDQSVREFNAKGGVQQVWTEFVRRVKYAPFYVHDPRGRIRVEPDERTLLVDEISRTQPKAPGVRTRIAEVTADEKVHVVGLLSRERDPSGGAYREGQAPLVMKPSPGGRLLVSTAPLGRRFYERSAAQRFVSGVFAVYIGIFALLDLGYYARLLAGQSEIGTVVLAKNVDGKSPRCVLSIRLPNGDSVDDDAEPAACLRIGPGAKVPVYVVGTSWFSHLGTAPAVHGAALLVGAIALAFAILFWNRRSRPWYEGKLVDHTMGKARPGKV